MLQKYPNRSEFQMKLWVKDKSVLNGVEGVVLYILSNEILLSGTHVMSALILP
jgi:hypothetical protein